MTLPFNPQKGGNQVLTANNSSQSVTVNKDAITMRVVNSGANIAHVRVGAGSQTATTADTPILAGTDINLHKGYGEETFAYISDAGTTLHVQPGIGGV